MIQPALGGAVPDEPDDVSICSEKAKAGIPAGLNSSETRHEAIADKGRSQPCRRGHYFVQIADRDHVFFEYTPKEDGAAVSQMFKGFSGYVQVDAKSIFNLLFEPPPSDLPDDESADLPVRKEVGCWSHARRKFWEATIAKDAVAREGLARIGRLFDLERKWKARPVADKKALRARWARPHLDAFFAWVDVEFARVKDQRGLLRTALGYAARNKDALLRYLDDGRLEMTNQRLGARAAPYRRGPQGVAVRRQRRPRPGTRGDRRRTDERLVALQRLILACTRPKERTMSAKALFVVWILLIPSSVMAEMAEMWTNRSTDYCLDTDGDGLAVNGGLVRMWRCVNHPNQAWSVIKVGSSNLYRLRNSSSNFCLDTDGAKVNGGQVRMWKCASHPNQLWEIQDIPAGYRLKNKASGFCLDTDGVAANGGAVRMWKRATHPHQSWKKSVWID